ncbi:MAG: hypothetical protein COA47_09170 [Robiginitomaculum sp.]|nr:MAG: hypothetical protein COA47_09170 [Robiginitomaculum sp.]
MTNKTTKTEDVIDAEFEPVVENVPESETATLPRKRAAWPLVWALFILATILGGAIGVLGGRFMGDGGAGDLRETNAKINALQAELAQITDQVQQSRTAFEQLIAEETAARKLEISQIAAGLTALEALGALPSEVESANISEATPPETSIDPAMVQELAALDVRLRQLEYRNWPEANPEPVDAGPVVTVPTVDLAPLRTRLTRLEETVSALPEFSDFVLLSELPDNSSLAQRMKKLENSTLSQRAGAAQQTALVDLKLAVQGSAPFAVAFASAKLQFADHAGLAALAPIAGRGAPTWPEVSASFSTLIPVILRAAKAPAENASLFSKAGAAITGLVSVRRTDGKGDGLEANLARADQALQTGDPDLAIGVVQGLSGTAVEAAKSWLQGAQDRKTISEVMHQLSAELVEGDAP